MQPLLGRALFSLRNLGTEESVLAVAEGLSCEDNALLRHEVAYVLGQIQSRDLIKFMGLVIVSSVLVLGF